MIMLRTFLAAGFVSVAGMASATSLTFDMTGGTSNGGVINQDYGDRVTSATTDASGAGTYGVGVEGATPNVVVEYLAADAREWTSGFSDLTNVFYSEPSGADFLGIRFTADAGFQVTLASFDVGNYIGSPIPIDTISVLAGGVTTTLESAYSLPATTAVNLAPNVTGSVVELMLDFTSAGGNGHDIGLDNVVFSQSAVTAPVPLPAGAPLLIAGVGAFAWMKRRKG